MDKTVEQITKYLDTLDARITPRRVKIQELYKEINELETEISTLMDIKDDMKAILYNLGYQKTSSKWIHYDQKNEEKGNS